MAVFLDSGIERVLHQPRVPESAGPPIFPDQKATRPLGIHEPSNLEKIFNTSYTRSLIEKMIYPKISERDIILPHAYSTVLNQLRQTVATDSNQLSSVDAQTLNNARLLLATMQDDYQAFCSGRDQLIGS